MKNQNQKKPSHYFSEKQDSQFIKSEFRARILGYDLQFKTGPGVFSKNRVDRGSLVLIENCEIKRNWKVLDLGSGIGVVGIAVAKKYGCEVFMTEINRRAYELSKENVLINGLKDKVKVFQGDMFEPLDSSCGSERIEFDTILLNPPQTAGKSICLKIIDESFLHLSDKGLLQMVARHNKGGETLSKYMEEVFGNVRQAAKKSGYRVYVSQKI